MSSNRKILESILSSENNAKHNNPRSQSNATHDDNHQEAAPRTGMIL